MKCKIRRWKCFVKEKIYKKCIVNLQKNQGLSRKDNLKKKIEIIQTN